MENHKRVVSLNVTKTRLLSPQIFAVRNTNFLRELAYPFLKSFKNRSIRVLSVLEHLAIASCFKSDKALQVERWKRVA